METTLLFGWLVTFVALGVLTLGVAGAMAIVKLSLSIYREARAARARRWWL